ncbi:uncharacterized protein ACLA_031630 [Aspergillus clavatus NRRL 1]|uniref:Uncharacterized protein n=1 Tax=Aspergillus clavatus (strain ATCC 1007 / CBS 513.65 / DSM 816 / NCTC 3887 / NRRL 1 / QM 1276 / 107) TaxID=344612 RepID=A1CS09_ASPCL|nr:uncharacterized protein ACLA_031630 [Aspergillus clavatus NRRL 1]EAW08430.1 hypothetical protein ACLA_031630 [Aspergillus clavatus NRRL 1]
MAAYLNGGVVAMLMTSVSDSLSGLKHGAIAVGYSRIIDWRLWVAWLFAAASKDFAFL